MCYRRIARTATATAVVVWAISGCTGHQETVPAAEVPAISTTATVSVPSSPLPGPEVLTDVLYRLADPEVPGTDKVALIEGAKPTDAETIDKFATALRDGGYLPLNLDAAAISWADRSPGNVTVDVRVTTANPDAGEFFFPMEFAPKDGNWQLSQATAKSLLAFGKAQTGSSTAEPAPPTP
ncbi:hypothetical protein BST33_08960 [Mycolicibacter minnesotensis]|uniref:Low molecular weight antigen MTB12-like C-terminal domain-containing protein n=1 Tax=Mycolicibacter minnesotensis TaxID=1118379 RepID=A0A7I7R9J4_9MYCO|nr:hypothetical protein [Mycolicibacter minnesotensis]ORB01305.1 hypothetical protein BST33_08960 [Mycolicibacter minnesotensis]BBY35349.1 hypothetical protein MMIN_34100 [Mycolicibacter minnesotensis]